jgi:hypothetical protein
MGNHDEWAAFGLPDPPPPWLSERAVAHQHWTRAQLSDLHRDTLKTWPYALPLACGEVNVVCVHYARGLDGEFADFTDLSVPEIERLYERVAGDVVIFGHEHRECDLQASGRRFLNPGSVGCHDRAEARALVLTPADGSIDVARLAVPYDDTRLLQAFDERQVPWRDVILRRFIRRR